MCKWSPLLGLEENKAFSSSAATNICHFRNTDFAVGENNHYEKNPEIKNNTCMPLLMWEQLLQANTFAFLIIRISKSEFDYLHFPIFGRCPCRFGAFVPSLASTSHSPASSCFFFLYFLHTHTKVNRQHTIARSTDSTVIPPYGQDLSQTSNMLNQSLLSLRMLGSSWLHTQCIY